MKLYIIEKKEGKKWDAFKVAISLDFHGIHVHYTTFNDEKQAKLQVEALKSMDLSAKFRITEWEKVK